MPADPPSQKDDDTAVGTGGVFGIGNKESGTMGKW
jgi:hypothetical protein